MHVKKTTQPKAAGKENAAQRRPQAAILDLLADLADPADQRVYRLGDTGRLEAPYILPNFSKPRPSPLERARNSLASAYSYEFRASIADLRARRLAEGRTLLASIKADPICKVAVARTGRTAEELLGECGLCIAAGRPNDLESWPVNWPAGLFEAKDVPAVRSLLRLSWWSWLATSSTEQDPFMRPVMYSVGRKVSTERREYALANLRKGNAAGGRRGSQTRTDLADEVYEDVVKEFLRIGDHLSRTRQCDLISKNLTAKYLIEGKDKLKASPRTVERHIKRYLKSTGGPGK